MQRASILVGYFGCAYWPRVRAFRTIVHHRDTSLPSLLLSDPFCTSPLRVLTTLRQPGLLHSMYSSTSSHLFADAISSRRILIERAQDTFTLLPRSYKTRTKLCVKFTYGIMIPLVFLSFTYRQGRQEMKDYAVDTL